MLPLSAPIDRLKGVGPKIKEKLIRCGIESIQDFLFHLPNRYQDKTRVLPIGRLRHGFQCVIQGKVVGQEVRFGGKRALLCRICDDSGEIHLRFFNFNKAQQARLQKGSLLRCYGEVRRVGKRLEMMHPEYQHIEQEQAPELETTLTPIYPTTEGLQQRSLRKYANIALDIMNDDTALPDYLPESVIAPLNLPSLKEALHYVHKPPQNANQYQLTEGIHPAQKRLAFEELIAHHLSLCQLRAKAREGGAPALTQSVALIDKFIENLPFPLTNAQQRVSEEIQTDLKKDLAMIRLVQGDVGCGKTVVAAIAALQAIGNDFQVALMAPTELLAEQHYQNFLKWFEPLGICITQLSSKMKAAAKRDALERIALGMSQLVVGTHALFQDQVQFKKLGLAIIDEQHRFGVHQRMALRDKGNEKYGQAHQLVMTATPIPRTLAMSVYSDLDHSIIDELPPGRTPIKTVVINNNKREMIIDSVSNAISEKRQVYWVCPLIEESETLQCQTAEDTSRILSEELPNVRVGMVHGRMAAIDKELIMADFKAGNIDLLVATTVIEVGVDVPNASLMVIDNAERMGLAQLHQLRGRVGRGSVESHCVLLYQAPLSNLARERLAVMREHCDGFKIAERDLELRGPGEVLGTRQAGMIRFRVADLGRDAALLPQVHEAAEVLMRDYPDCIQPLIDRWLSNLLHYGQV